MANGGHSLARRMERIEAVSKAMTTARGLTRVSGVATQLAKEFGCAESTIWDDRLALLKAAEADAKMKSPGQQGAEFLGRLRSAQADAAEDGAHGPRIAGLGLEAKVLGVLAADKVDVTVKADAQPLPPALYELLETVWRENQAGELEGTARELWARIERAMSGPEVVEVKRVE